MREHNEVKSEAKKAVAAVKAARYRTLYDELNNADGEKKIYRKARARKRATEYLEDAIQIKDNKERLLHLSDIQRWCER